MAPATMIAPRINFNPRTREGCDLAPAAGAVEVWEFQSTHP